MINVQIKVKWNDKPTSDCRFRQEIRHIKDITAEFLSNDIRDNSHFLRCNVEWDIWRHVQGQNRGIYPGANCLQYLCFCDDDTVLKQIEIKERPGSTYLIHTVLPEAKVYFDYYKRVSVLDGLE